MKLHDKIIAMRRSIHFKKKMRIASVLCIICALVIGINYINNRSFSQIENSMHSVYKDRLLVESYIFRLSGHLHNKKMISNSFDDLSIQDQLNDSISLLISQYDQTLLTRKESNYFAAFKNDFSLLKRIEIRLIAKKENRTEDQNVILSIYKDMDQILRALSEIQINETNRIIQESDRKFAFASMSSQLEISIVIFLGLIAQIVLFRSKDFSSGKMQKFGLN